MAMALSEIAGFFRLKPRARKPQRARRSRSSTPEFLNNSGTLSPSGPSSRSSHGSPTTPGGLNVLVRVKSWFERSKSVAPEGFFSLDVGKEKIRYLVPITYLSHEDLQKLLDDSVAEFGHTHEGPLQLTCEQDEFEEVMETIQKSFEGEDTKEERQRLIA